MRMHAKFALLIVLAIALFAPAAVAQTAEENEAFSLFKEGRKEMDAGSCGTAIELFERAYAVFPLPQILLREGECREKLGDLEGALQSYLRVRTEDQKILAKAFSAIQSLRSRMDQSPEVSVEANVPGAEVVIDQTPSQRTPVTVKLPRGQHRFEFRKPGYTTVIENRDIQGSGRQKVAAALVAEGGHVVLVSSVGSFNGVVVRIDDREFAPADAPGSQGRTDPIPLPPGIRKLLCVKDGRVPFLSSFTVPSSGVVEVTCRMDPIGAHATSKSGDSRTNPWKWVTFSAGAAVAVAGAGLSGWYFYKKENIGVAKGAKDYHEGWYGVGMMGVGVTVAIVSLFVFPDPPAASPRTTKISSRPIVTAAPVRGGAIASFSLGF